MSEESSIPTNHSELEQLLDLVMLKDVAKLKRFWRETNDRLSQAKACERSRQQFTALAEKSKTVVAKRRASVPELEFPESLPVSEKRREIAELIDKNQVVILAGETGSGKTTQLPKICLELGRGVNAQIGHTQPRRIAASSVANRIAEELKSPLGDLVGYQVRFNDQSTDASLIKLMTDGILLAEVQHDPLLNRYDTIIIDEAHERSLNIDFLLGYLKQILPRRPDLKLIITSATIDLEKFSKHFNDAPIIEVSGRTYPVDILYRPWGGELEDESQAIVEAIEEILTMPQHSAGDILVFMSGERDIREAADAIRKANFQHLEVLPLYARLSMSEQRRVFQPHRGRRVVLATNVAETSITVPGIGYVIDPGFARISRYSVRTKVQRLPIEAVSQASANQRAGRCGRVSHGVCIRLYSEEDFQQRAEFTDAEILRTNLASVVLQMLSLGIGDVKRFPFVDLPEGKQIKDAFKLLQELQAVTVNGKLNSIGRKLASIPLDPKLARMLLAGHENQCLKEMLVITSALSIQDPRERPEEKRQASDEKHRRFWDDNSDFLSYLNLWQYFDENRQVLSQNQWRKQCKKDFLSYLRMREWRELHHQIRVASKKIGLKENETNSDYQSIHRALLSGLLGNIALKAEDKGEHFYLGARNRRFFIFPGSSQFKKKPKWIVASELLETTKLFGLCVAKIDPDWVLQIAKHLVKHHYYQPHYNARNGQVSGFDRITLFGLVLSEKTKVNYADIDKKVAREVFIRSALVEGGYAQSRQGRGKFFERNKALMEEVQVLEEKSRRRDIMVDDEVVFQFYEERIPETVVSLNSFEHWRKKAEEASPELLWLPKHLLMQHDADSITEAQFPDSIELDGMTFKLSYHFDPKHPDDGVSVQIPANVLHTLTESRLQWLVPGLLRDKCIALIKALPKQWRKQFVPVPHSVDQLFHRLSPSNMPLTEALRKELQRSLGRPLPEDLWEDVELEAFYHMNIQVLDDKLKVIDRDRNLVALQEKYKGHVQSTLKSAGQDLEQEQLETWSFGILEESCTLKQAGMNVKAFPSLVVEKSGVAFRMLDNPKKAAVESRAGVVELLLLKLNHSVRYLKKNLLRNKDAALSVIKLGRREDVVIDLIRGVIQKDCLQGHPLPRTEQEFDAAAERGRATLVANSEAMETLLLSILDDLIKIKATMKANKNSLALALAFSDINQQLNMLISPRFLSGVSQERLEQYPRYLKAVLLRIEKAPQNIQKDKQYARLMASFTERHMEKLERDGDVEYQCNEQWQNYRWMLEELRVSLFAQNLGTQVPVSEKRLEKLWREGVIK